MNGKAKTIAQINRLAADGRITLWHDLRTLFDSVEWISRHCHDLLIDGRKDDARDWVRWVQNSNVLGVLGSDVTRTISKLKPEQIEALAVAIDGARLACHPLEAVSSSTDLGAIRVSLQTIVLDISDIKQLLAGLTSLAVHTSEGVASALPGNDARQGFLFRNNAETPPDVPVSDGSQTRAKKTDEND